MITFEEWWVERHGINWLARESSATRDEARAAWYAATKAEREACAKLADEIAYGPYELSGREIGEAIRARGNSE